MDEKLVELIADVTRLVVAENRAADGSQRDEADMEYADLICKWTPANLRALEATPRNVEGEVERLRKERDELGTVLLGLTPGGSEYFLPDGDGFRVDPEACQRVIREKFDMYHRLLRPTGPRPAQTSDLEQRAREIAELLEIAVDDYEQQVGVVKSPCHWTSRARVILATRTRPTPNLYEAAERALNYITNTESEWGITLECGDMLRAALAPSSSEPGASQDDGGLMPYVPTGAEVQSGHDRLQWAEGLIRQLPDTHDGRNSWLLNYGRSDEAKAHQEKRNLTWNETSRSTSPPTRAETPNPGEREAVVAERPWQPWERNYSGNRVGVRFDGDWTILHVLSGGAETTTSIREHETWDLALRLSPKLKARLDELFEGKRAASAALHALTWRGCSTDLLRSIADEEDCDSAVCENAWSDMGGLACAQIDKGTCGAVRAEELRELAKGIDLGNAGLERDVLRVVDSCGGRSTKEEVESGWSQGYNDALDAVERELKRFFAPPASDHLSARQAPTEGEVNDAG